MTAEHDKPEFTDGIDRYSGPADNNVPAEAKTTMYQYIHDHDPMKPWTAATECDLDTETALQAIRALTLDGYVTPTADGNLRIDTRYH